MIDPTSEKIIKDIIKEKDNRIKTLEQFIKDKLGIDASEIEPEEQIATPYESEQFGIAIEQLEITVEKYSNIFDYGRSSGKEKMAESL